jgi:hypothetical protein
MYRTRSADSILEPRTRTVSIFNVIPLNQHFHERHNGLLVQVHDRSCGKSKSPALLTEWTHYAEPRKSKNSTRKRNFKRKQTRSLCVEKLQIYRMTPKNYYEILWDYPFKVTFSPFFFTDYYFNTVKSGNIVTLLSENNFFSQKNIKVTPFFSR